ncbi:MAG: aminotransferase class IV [Salinibacterium sp.]|nr:aminotransferase class IV [Salinibacterium sp.]
MSVLAILNRPSRDAPAHAPASPPFHFADAAEPQLSVLDLGATRGDGIFETVSVGYGRPQALEHHLRRFAASARTLDLPAPDLDAWRAAILAVVAELGDVDEGYVKTVMTRGIEGDDKPTGWVYGSPSPDHSRARREGVRIVLLDRGYRHDIEATAPWLLAGAKTLSYAVNRAVAREAARREADDVVFVSSDGILLEGPTSTLVFRRGNQLLTPGTGLGILDGTTQANVFRYAESVGMSTGFELAGPDALRAADAAWLVSSVRLAAPIRAVDGVDIEIDHEFTAALNEYLKRLEE